MPVTNEEIVKQLYALFQESRSRSSSLKQENITKADIAKIAKFKKALLDTPFDLLTAVSSGHAQFLRSQFLQYIMQMDSDTRQEFIEKHVNHLCEQLYIDLKEIHPNDLKYMSIRNAFNEKLLRTPFSFFNGENDEAIVLRNYFVQMVSEQIKSNKGHVLGEMKNNQSKEDLKLLLTHIKDTKVEEAITKIITADQRAVPLAHRAMTSGNKNKVSLSQDSAQHKRTK